MRVAMRLGGAALALASVAGCAGGNTSSAGAAATGGYATTYRVNDIETDQPVELASLKGRPILLSSWATWCEECRTELPELDRWAAEQAAEGVAVVSVNVNLTGPADDEIDSILSDLHLSIPTWRDDRNLFSRTFRTFGVPANVLLDANGHVVAQWNGAIDPDEPEVAAALADVVTSQPG